MKAFSALRNIDDKRRLVLPEEFPPGSRVLIEQVGEDTWIVKRHKPARNVVTVAFPIVRELPEDPAWEKVERAFSDAANRHIPEPKE